MGRRSAASRPRLLLFAEPLQREGLSQWLAQGPEGWQVIQEDQAAEGAPALVIWCLAVPPERQALARELSRLQERWQPAPLLLLLPTAPPYPTAFLLDLPVQGLLEAPDAATLQTAVRTLLGGGRVVEIAARSQEPWPGAAPALGLGQWLLISGLQQIDAERALCHRLLDPPPAAALAELLLRGRLRELEAARRLLLWLWGPLQLAWGHPLLVVDGTNTDPPAPTGALPEAAAPAVALSLRQRTADGIWEAVEQRLRQGASAGLSNRSGQVLALEGLLPERRSDLLLALLEQIQQLRSRLQQSDPRGERLLASWEELQPELRRTALRRMAGTYVQLPQEGRLRPVADTLVQASQLEGNDPELPEATPMLATLVQARPLLVEGRLLPPDEPQAVLYLEMLLANWLVRSAEQIAAEVLAACAEWPELRRYLLRPELLSTRNLERLRNQLNAQQRWNSWIRRPVALYESRRELFRLEAGAIELADLTEPRDRELRQLGWPQQVVTLALEARDALAPQLQSVVRTVGDLLMVVLTQVIGRAIGLVGRGIAQGMGRSLHRS